MATLLLQLVGPMQAWGVTSRFDERDSGLEPSKSDFLKRRHHRSLGPRQ